MTSRDLVGQTRDPNTLIAISRKRLERETPFQRTTNRKWHIGLGYWMVTWLLTSRGPQRWCEAVRSAILATAWLLVLVSLDSPPFGISRKTVPVPPLIFALHVPHFSFHWVFLHPECRSGLRDILRLSDIYHFFTNGWEVLIDFLLAYYT